MYLHCNTDLDHVRQSMHRLEKGPGMATSLQENTVECLRERFTKGI